MSDVPTRRSRTCSELQPGRDWLLWRQGIDERLTGECPVLEAEEEVVENNPGRPSVDGPGGCIESTCENVCEQTSEV